MELSISVYGLARLEFLFPVLDSMLGGSSLLTQTFCQIGPSLLAYGIACPDSFLSLLDFVSFGFPLFLRARARPDSSLSTYGIA